MTQAVRIACRGCDAERSATLQWPKSNKPFPVGAVPVERCPVCAPGCPRVLGISYRNQSGEIWL